MRYYLRRRLFSVPIILTLNTLVFILWQILPDARESWLTENFLVSWTGLAEGHYFSLIGSAFSHNLFFHFFLNMYVLLNFGQIVESYLGSRRFFKFYMTAGIISSFMHSFVSAYIMHQPDLPALGASGAISGVILLFSLMFPRERILILGILPLPAIFGALAFIGLDIWGLIAQSQGHGLPIGHGAHLGGAFTGIIYYFVLRRRVQKQKIGQQIF